MRLCYHEGVRNARIGRWIRKVERIGNGCKGENDTAEEHHDLRRQIAMALQRTWLFIRLERLNGSYFNA